MEQKTGEIKEILQAASLNELPAFISTYEKDTRSGVVALVNKAKKRLEDYEKELLRTEKLKEYEKKYSSLHIGEYMLFFKILLRKTLEEETEDPCVD